MIFSCPKWMSPKHVSSSYLVNTCEHIRLASVCNFKGTPADVVSIETEISRFKDENSLRSKRFRAISEQRTKSESARKMARVSGEWLSFHFSRGQNRKSFFAPETKRKPLATQAKTGSTRRTRYSQY